MASPASTDATMDEQANIVAWFVALVKAHFAQRHAEAAQALTALEGRGVSVKFETRPMRRRRKAVTRE